MNSTRTARGRQLPSLYRVAGTRLAALALMAGLLVLTTASRPASPPMDPPAQTSPEEQLTLRLEARGVAVREVDLASNPARIAYDQAIGEARDTLALNWVMICRTALEVVPGLETIRLEMYYLGDPSLAVTIRTDTVISEDLAQAIAGFQIEDVRPPEEAIRQGMALLGIPHAVVSRTTETTTIHFVVPPALEAEAILELWIQAFSLAAEKSPETALIVLDLALSDGNTGTVEALTTDVRALLDGTLDPVEFAASLVVSGGESAEPEETARGPLPVATGLAVGGAYFLAAAVVVGGWVFFRLRTSLTRLQQVILLASAAGILMMGCLILYLSLRVPPLP
jgi:hypothetical protein